VSARSWVLFIGVGSLWGTPFFFVDVALDEGLPPGFVTWVRVALAALVLLAVAAHARLLRIERRHLGWIVVFGLVNTAAPFWFIALGQEHVSGSVAAILVASVPIVVAAFALFGVGERPTPGRTLGLGIGFAGVVALMGVDLGGRVSELLGAGAVLLGAAGYAAGALILEHRLAGIDARTTQSLGLAAATVLLTPLALVELPGTLPSAEASAAMLGGALLPIALGFLGFAALVPRVGPLRATVVSYVSPFVAIALGVGFASESVGPGAVIGLVLILAGSALATRATRDASAAPTVVGVVPGEAQR
jgi:drug/metabolite transporter (DMT)-like permease